MNKPDDLATQAEAFAQRIQKLLQQVVDAPDNITKTVILNGGQSALIRLRNQEGIELAIDGKRSLRLSLSYSCSCLHPDSYMRVEKSSIRVFAVIGRHFGPVQNDMKNENDSNLHFVPIDDLIPLFRYGYVRKQRTKSLPSSHIHFVGYNRGLNDLLFGTLNAKGNKAKKKRQSFIASGKYPHIENIHFPTGGARFRPGLEDVLEMLISEFDIDHTPQALDVIQKSREAFRLSQIKTLMREFPDLAYEELSKPEHNLIIEGEKPIRHPHIASLERY